MSPSNRQRNLEYSPNYSLSEYHNRYMMAALANLLNNLLYKNQNMFLDIQYNYEHKSYTHQSLC